MERRDTIAIIGTVILFLGAVSCDKTERKTKKFIEEGSWSVDSLVVGNNDIDDLPNWSIIPCDDHENFCFGKWTHPNGSHTNFYWKFSNMGGNFEFISDSMETETGTMAYAQCVNFSGDYKVKKSKNHTLHIESEMTDGYPGVLVTIMLSGVE